MKEGSKQHFVRGGETCSETNDGLDAKTVHTEVHPKRKVKGNIVNY